jgi:hypothetical protein
MKTANKEKKKGSFTNALDYNLQHLRNFFLDRSALDVANVENECKLPKDTLRHFIKERRGLAVKHIEKVEGYLLKYGYIPL